MLFSFLNLNYQDMIDANKRTFCDTINNENENHFVNFTGATFALATHVYTSVHKGRSQQQVCRAT